MIQVLINFFSFNALNTPPEVYAALGSVWLLLLLAGMASVFSQNFGIWLKLLWLLLMITIPVGGLFLYSVFCLATADYSFLKMFGLHRQKALILRNSRSRKA
jgi:hypothetical protein